MSVIYRRSISLPLAGEAGTNPEKWNNDWEAVFRANRRTMTPESHFDSAVSENKKYLHNNNLDRCSTNLLATCRAQYNLTLKAAQLYRHGLEARWLSASRAVRRTHLIGALATVCSKAWNLNAARRYCPTELDLTRLSSDGQSFLDLLRSALLDDAVIPKTPRYIAHPEWDAFAAKQEARTDRTDQEKVAWAEVLMLRTNLICRVLRFTLRNFFELEPLLLTLEKREKKAWKREDPLQHVYDEIETKRFGPEIARERKKLIAADHKKRNTNLQSSCSYPGCTNRSPADGSSKFKHCPRCFQATQRRVFYCSPVCQKADWKLQHKAVCGKPLSFDDVATLPDIPLPESDNSQPDTITVNTVPTPTAAQAASHAQEWEHGWETLFRGPPIVSTFFCFVDMVDRNKLHGLEATLASYPYLLSNTSAAQRQLTLDAQRCFEEGFEARWRAASPGERYLHILGGLASVCSTSQNLNLGRAYCGSELRVEPMCEEDRGFVDLVRSAMLDPSGVALAFVCSQPKGISSQSWDAIVEGDPDGDEEGEIAEVTRAVLKLMRTKVICYVLDFILRSFCGMESPILTTSKVDDILDRGSDADSSLVTVDSVKLVKEGTIEPRASCSYLNCLKLANADSTFQRCGRCTRYQVFYCSRECQVADWKLRHKKACGKMPTFDDVAILPEFPADALRAAVSLMNF